MKDYSKYEKLIYEVPDKPVGPTPIFRRCTRIQLQNRLIQIRKLLYEGKTIKQMCIMMNIPRRTMDHYVRRITKEDMMILKDQENKIVSSPDNRFEQWCNMMESKKTQLIKATKFKKLLKQNSKLVNKKALEELKKQEQMEKDIAKLEELKKYPIPNGSEMRSLWTEKEKEIVNERRRLKRKIARETGTNLLSTVQRKRLAAKKWREDNPDRVRENKRKWSARNRVKIREQHRAWRKQRNENSR